MGFKRGGFINRVVHKVMRLQTEVLESMGCKGRDWMQHEFSWGSVAERMEAAYEWIRRGGVMPECVSEA